MISEAVHPLHWGPVEPEGLTVPLLSPPNQLLILVDIHRKVVLLAPVLQALQDCADKTYQPVAI